MSKSHTKETDEFNNYISYIGNFKKFSADKIHRDEEVKALFEYYMLKSGKDLFKPKIFEQRVLAYWKKKYPNNNFVLYNNNTDISKNSRTAYRVEELFKIDNFNLAMTD